MTRKDPIDEDYGKMLEQYVIDVKQTEAMEVVIQKQKMLDYFTAHSVFDKIFPFHMRLGFSES